MTECVELRAVHKADGQNEHGCIENDTVYVKNVPSVFVVFYCFSCTPYSRNRDHY